MQFLYGCLVIRLHCHRSNNTFTQVNVIVYQNDKYCYLLAFISID